MLEKGFYGAAAFFIGYLADFLARRTGPMRIAIVFCGLLALQGALWIPHYPRSVVTVAEDQDNVVFNHESVPAALWLRDHYHGGGILYDDSHPMLILKAGINMGDYYLSGPIQAKALADPVRYAKWIVLAPFVSGDAVNVGMFRGDKDGMVEENAALARGILGTK